MKVVFSIPFATNWGESIFICGDHPALGNNDKSKGIALTYTGEKDMWVGEIVFAEFQACIHYNYFLRKEDGQIRREWGNPRQLSWDRSREGSVHLFEYWASPKAEEKAWFSSAFSRVITPSNGVSEALSAICSPQGKGQKLSFAIHVPRIGEGLGVGLMGNTPELGKWEPSKVIPLKLGYASQWSTEIFLSSLNGLEYKYVLYQLDGKEIVEWEQGANRLVPPSVLESNAEKICIHDSIFHYSSQWKGAGVAFPIFSMRSNRGFGVGEFDDLFPFIDWAKETGMHVIQILPINDTIATYTWKDSYPYAAISVFALHPIYANLQSIASYYGKELPGSYISKKTFLNSLEEVDIVAVIKAKFEFFRELYKQNEQRIWEDEALLKFVQENASWLKPYAIFCHLRDTFQSADFQNWPSHKEFSEETLAEFFPTGTRVSEGIGLYLFIQFHLDLQLSEAAAYARKKGVLLKGDIPIGIYRNSVDAWTDPHLFNMDGQAGAPPDFFSAGGQNWGFPTYRWDIMALDGYAWWRQRLQKMAAYFDAYRIDHVLGFFRIWEIPYELISGALGHFNPSLPFAPHEIWDRKIPFEKDRYTLPFLRGHILSQRIPDHLRAFVEETFLIQDHPGYYRFQEEYKSQRTLASRLEEEVNLSVADKEELCKVLFGLMHEVIFIQDPHRADEAYHPRFLINDTQSFKELDGWVQDRILELYTDYFFNRHEEFWRKQGLTKLPAILNATDMLVCAEDLGMVPACVPEVLEELGILTLEIQRMPKENNGLEFISGSHNPYLSVFSSSSHDIAPLRAWWEEDLGRTQRYFNQVLNLPGTAPDSCEPWVVEVILKQHLNAPSMWAIFPIQDLIALEDSFRHPSPQAEQINDPSNPEHYWRYRMHISVEELSEAKEFIQRLNRLVQESGRNMDY